MMTQWVNSVFAFALELFSLHFYIGKIRKSDMFLGP